MPTPAIREIVEAINLSGRVFHSTTIVASPTANAETIVCSLTIDNNAAVMKAIYIVGWVAFTVGTSGVSAQVKIRQTDASGTAKGDSGACTATAAALATRGVLGVDTAPTVPGQVYVLTLTVASAGAGSTVSAVELLAVVV
jgi:hypothetical protein